MQAGNLVAILLLPATLGVTLPQQGPVPAAKPGSELSPPPMEAPAQPPQEEETADHAQPERENPEELKACMADLAGMGAKFAEADPISEEGGCGIESPLKVAEILPGVSVGGAIMRCKTAHSLARWIRHSVQPSLEVSMPDRRITALAPGSTYACRLRNNAATGKISEHAKGNAFDVSGFGLDDGTTLEMKPREEDSTLEGAFQRTATASACLYFTTVLAPGSDPAHETHLHLDVMDRKNNYRYCR